MRKTWFKEEEGAPPPLRHQVRSRVRFEEVDTLGIVWHGRYSSYFEDARVALGQHYGIGYLQLWEQGLATPIRQLHIDYRRPLHFNEEIRVAAILHWTPAARLNYSFEVFNQAGELCADGYSVQMMLDRELRTLFVPPAFFHDFLARWQRGEL